MRCQPHHGHALGTSSTHPPAGLEAADVGSSAQDYGQAFAGVGDGAGKGGSGAWISQRSVDPTPRGQDAPRHQRSTLPSSARVEALGTDGVELPEARRSGCRTGRESHRPLEAIHVAGTKKKARREGRTIVFIDESGLSERPSISRTWAPKGQTPQLTFNFNWGKLAVIAGITWWRFYFRL